MIGRAPKVGRPRWMDLAKLMGQDNQATERLRKTLPAVTVSDSNGRFQLAIDALKDKPAQTSGQLQLKIIATSAADRAFAKFVESRLPVLKEEFEKGEH